MVSILFISHAPAYVGRHTDVPKTYAATAADPEVELWHAEPGAVLRTAGAQHARSDSVAACRVPADVTDASFGQLASLPALARPIDSFDLVFDRVLKPLPDGYLRALAGWRGRVRFVNDPVGIEAQLDPHFALRAANRFMPAAVVTADVEEMGRFFDSHQAIVIKRPNSCGGRAVYRVRRAEGHVEVAGLTRPRRIFDDFDDGLASLGLPSGESCTLMRFLPRVHEGDLRVVTLDGRPLGAYLRKASGWIQNVGAGARCCAVPVDAELATAIEATCGPYQSAGVRLLGYDFLVDDDGHRRISEINGGNIGGIARLEALSGVRQGARFIDWMKVRARG